MYKYTCIYKTVRVTVASRKLQV